MKLVVGLMLVSFGSFWGGEGVGVHWSRSDLSLLGLLAVYAAIGWVAVRILARSSLPSAAAETG
ncbi:MAG: hypothetical protein ACREOD_00740 [Candidatus Dormibacteria bacterium]